jgi:hypothetical protein
MYTNIPSIEAANLTIEMAKKFNLELYGLLDTDLFNLLKLVMDNNFLSSMAVYTSKYQGYLWVPVYQDSWLIFSLTTLKVP